MADDASVPINRRRLFVASCVALVANAMIFSTCTDIMGDFETAFQLSKARVGLAVSIGAIAGTAMLFFGGALLDYIGIGTALWLACLAHLCGLTAFIVAQGFWSLALGGLFLAIAGSLVEAAINPLAAAMYPEKKIHIMNVLHAWWPGGLILGGLLAYGFSEALKRGGASEATIAASWQIKLAFVYVPVLCYAALIFGQRFPKTERAQAGVPARVMVGEALRPAFLLLVFCMFLTASTELAPGRWVGVFINDIVGIRGILFLVYTSGLMFLLRFFAGPIAHKLSPLGLLVASSVVSTLGLLAMSYAQGVLAMFMAATVFGVGVTFYWPTMLGVTAEWFPKGGAFVLGIIGAAGGLFLSYVSFPGMGAMHDHYTIRALPPAVAAAVVNAEEGRVDDTKVKALGEEERKTVESSRREAARTTFRWVALMPAALVIIFSAMWVFSRMRGAYQAEVLPATAAGDSSPPTEVKPDA
jgi:MFS family permease